MSLAANGQAGTTKLFHLLKTKMLDAKPVMLAKGKLKGCSKAESKKKATDKKPKSPKKKATAKRNASRRIIRKTSSQCSSPKAKASTACSPKVSPKAKASSPKAKASTLKRHFTEAFQQPQANDGEEEEPLQPAVAFQRTKDFDFIDAINETIDMCALPLSARGLSIDDALGNVVSMSFRQSYNLLFFKTAVWPGIEQIQAPESEQMSEESPPSHSRLSGLRKDMQKTIVNAVFQHVQAAAAAALADVATNASAHDEQQHGGGAGRIGRSIVKLREWVKNNVQSTTMILLQPSFQHMSNLVSTAICNQMQENSDTLPTNRCIVKLVLKSVESEFPHDWLVWLAGLITSYCKRGQDSQNIDSEDPSDQTDDLDTLKAIFGIKVEDDTDGGVDGELMFSTLLCRTRYCYTTLQTVLRDVADLPSLTDTTINKLNIREKSLDQSCLEAFWMKVVDTVVAWRMSSSNEDVLHASLIRVCSLQPAELSAADVTKALGGTAADHAAGAVSTVEAAIVDAGGAVELEPQAPTVESGHIPLKATICSDIIKHTMCKNYTHKTHNQLQQYLSHVHADMFKFSQKLSAKNICITIQQNTQSAKSQVLPWMLSATDVSQDMFLPFFGDVRICESPQAGLVINEIWGSKTTIMPNDNLFCHAWLVPVVESDDEATLVIKTEPATIMLPNGTFKPKEVLLQLPYLVPKPEVVGKKGVVLSRSACDLDVGNLRAVVRVHQKLITTTTKANL